MQLVVYTVSGERQVWYLTTFFFVTYTKEVTETVVEKAPTSSDTTSALPLKVAVPTATVAQKKKPSPQFFFALLAVVVLIVGGITSLILVRNNNDTRQQATGPATYSVCRGVLEACDNAGNPCCAGYVCQGTNNARRCEDPGTTNICGDDATCGGPGGWIAFRCDQLRLYDDSPVPQCRENPITVDSYEEALEYTGGCGQVDEVCVGGEKNRQLCGSFQILDGECRQPSPPPSAEPSPQPSPTPGVTPSPNPSPTPPAPVCVAISANTQNFTVGTQVTFTCGTVATATAYEFRVRLPDQTIRELAATASGSTASLPFTITSTGQYAAQCRICTGAGSAQSCQEWEPLP